MSPNIRIDQEVYDFLKGHAEPFADTPNSVLRRLLGLEYQDSLMKVGDEVEVTPKAAPSGDKRRKSTSRSSRSRGRRHTPRVPPGALLPEDEYVMPLLTALAERGGSAPAREAIEVVGQQLASKLTPLDKERTASGAIRWQNRVQFVRLRLVEEGLLAKNSHRGVWALTEAGVRRVKEGV